MNKYFTDTQVIEFYDFCRNEEIPISEKVIPNAQLIMGLINRYVKAYIVKALLPVAD